MTRIEKSTGHADNESVFCNSTPVPTHDFKPVECNDSAFHTAEEKTNIKENHGTLCHLNDSKVEADLSLFEEKDVLDSTGRDTKDIDEFFKAPELYSPAFTGYSLKHNENEEESSPIKDDRNVIFHFKAHKNTEVPLESASEISHVGADKHIMELESPEMITCYKESNDNVVKDICIDEGVPIVDKVLNENMNDDSVGTCFSLYTSGDKNDKFGEDFQKEMISEDPSKMQDAEVGMSTAKDDIGPLASDSLEDNVDEESAKDTYLEDLMKLFGPKCSSAGQIANDFSEKQYTGYNPFLMESSYSELHCQSSEEAMLESHATLPKNVESKENDHSAENISNQVIDTDPMPIHEDGISDKTSASEEVQCGNIAKTAGNSIEHPSRPKLHDTHNSEGKASASLSDQFADGEASFSSVGPMSGLITYSGTIPHSGNISLRSDSSTTSARSFAFPVLQSEWNSSPVRMAKADRRFWKRRGWRHGLLCCRF